jgi:hypothetical protein
MMNLTSEQWKEFMKEHLDDLFWYEEDQEAFLTSGDKTTNSKQECDYFVKFKDGVVEVEENTQKQYSFLTIKQVYEILKKEIPEGDFKIGDVYSLCKIGILSYLAVGKSFIVEKKEIEKLIKFIKSK